MLTAKKLREIFPDIDGPTIAKVFKAIKNIGPDISEEFAINVVQQVVAGTWNPQRSKVEIVEGSALWFLRSFKFCPTLTGEGGFSWAR